MPDYCFAGDSIECEKANLVFRKITPKLPPKPDSKLGTLYKFKLEIDGAAHIHEELSPKKALLDMTSHLEKDDCVKGNTLLLLTTNALKKTGYKIGKGSSKHSAQFFLNKYFTFTKIEKQYPTVPQKN